MPTKPDKKQSHQSDGSGGKSSNPHTNLTKHHTCRANFLLARHNTQPLVALNFGYIDSIQDLRLFFYFILKKLKFEL